MTIYPDSPLNLCIAGMGGYARAHHEMSCDLEAAGQLRLLATCDPRHAALGSVASDFAFSRRGVDVLGGFEEMLEQHGREARLVTIATPIHLHAAMHEAVVSRNLGCYLEKPPTLDPEELEGMIASERTSDFQTEVSFNYIAEDWRHDLKRRLLEGEWGELRALSFFGAWSRDAAYYQRSPWAGKSVVDGRLVLDSPFGNAAAHHIHNLLFFAGKELHSWASPQEVLCEMVRAYEIDGPDTVFSSMATLDGIELRVAISHACQTRWDLMETLHCERADIQIRPYRSVEILHHSGKREHHETPIIKLLEKNFVHYLSYLRGGAERPLTTLADCQPLVNWNAMNYLSAQQIETAPSQLCGSVSLESKPLGGRFIIGVEEVMRHFIRTGEFPSEQGVAWASRGRKVAQADTCRLRSHILEVINPVAAGLH